jgi:hypothetical protein
LIIVKIIGGLGNQMFQYAYAKSLQQKGYEVKVDISAFETYKLHGGYQLDKYNINLKVSSIKENNNFYRNTIINKTLQKLKLYKGRIIKEKSLLFSNDLLDIDDGNYIDGFFQSEQYFLAVKEKILKEFTIKDNLSDYAKLMGQKIQSADNTVSIHIRRGDYIFNKSARKIHGICSLSYYQQAIELLKYKFPHIKYFIFSDDIDWCKENLKINNAIYMDSEEKASPYEDMYLMSLCEHNIIANSSFSWWGAWLNKNPEKIVISPLQWFAITEMNNQTVDLIPNTWIRI